MILYSVFVVWDPITVNRILKAYDFVNFLLDMTRQSSYTSPVAFGEDEGSQRFLQAGMSYEEFVAAMTAVWQYSADLFWKMHEIVCEANPHWNPPEGEEGNEPSA